MNLLGKISVCAISSLKGGLVVVMVGDAEEGDVALHQHHHSALVPLITSLCFTASLHNNYPACSFEGSRAALLASCSNGQAPVSAASHHVQRTRVGAVKLVFFFFSPLLLCCTINNKQGQKWPVASL